MEAVEITYSFFDKLIWNDISSAYYKLKKG